MDRRDFLQKLAVAAAAIEVLPAGVSDAQNPPTKTTPLSPSEPVDLSGFQLTAAFTTKTGGWKVYEDWNSREGALVFVSSRGEQIVLPKSAEASFPEADPPYLGLSLKDIGMESRDLLAERLLEKGDPDPQMVKSAAPPLASADKDGRRWTTFVGTKEAYDVAPVYYGGSTRTYHPIQYSSELHQATEKNRVYDGLVGGWMPAARKVIPVSDSEFWEIIVFGDVDAHDKFIVQTWHRTALIKDGKIAQAVYGHSYPAFPPARQDPKAEEFYRALLAFCEYWQRQLNDFAPAKLPDRAWIDMSRHAFAKDLMTRPGGVYPKYGAVDRDYAGSEYDGFQDIFTSAVYANLEWGRFEHARDFIDNYFTDFVDARGMINMRGPETAQFGMTLTLLAKYFNYTRDSTLILKHRSKIEATARLLADMHDESLKRPPDDPGHGLIHGWSESDSCLHPDPGLYWKPYYANSAFAARGFKDIAQTWGELAHSASRPEFRKIAKAWDDRSKTLQARTLESIQQNIQRDKNPPYIGLFPGTRLTFRESLEQEKPSPQLWPHRPYCELLQADVLPRDLANLVIDCVRAYGATTLGVVANVWGFSPEGREILGFITYGYAQMLLRLDRIEEFLLFLYAHRFHDHSRGSWVAGEVTNINGDSALFCMPAQHTIPLLVRWMMVLEDSDEEKLYLGKGLPREWVASEKEISIHGAPTRWGRVNFSLQSKLAAKRVEARLELSRAAPEQVELKFRLPAQLTLKSASVNGAPTPASGADATITFAPRDKRQFEIIGQLQ
ncbi:MAG TPA: hypothetical protein VMH85_12165 [Terriglobales bacterium]|nr:hypothetical protein [Terriglobales bacterium]